tara:strand:+ start:193 stop:627 length:435 start_codon:yes stop_codon:yes gene_type:complete
MLKKKLDLPVFCLPDGSVTEHLRQTFKAFLTEAGLLKCLKTGRDLTLYSLRHTYATFALVNGGIDIHALTKQMGTSIGMIERHYSHLTLRMKKDFFNGKRYELLAEEYAERKTSEKKLRSSSRGWITDFRCALRRGLLCGQSVN